MSKTLLDIAQTTLHSISIVLFGLVILVIIAGAVRPQLFKKFLHEFSERKYIFAVATFTALLSGTIFMATEPVSNQTYVSQNNTKQAVVSVDPIAEATEDETRTTIDIKDVAVPTAIPFATQQQNDSSLAAGQSVIVQRGVNGQETSIYTVTYNNGVEVSRTLKSKSVTVQPVPQITAIGTKVAAAPQAPAAASAAPAHNPNQASRPQQQHNSYLTDHLCRTSSTRLCAYLRAL